MNMGNNRWLRNSFVYLMIIIGVIIIFYTLLPSFGATSEEPLTTVVAMAKNNDIREIVIDGRKLTVFPRGGSSAGTDRFTSRIGADTDVLSLLVESGVDIGPPTGVQVTFKGSSGLSSLFGLMLNFSENLFISVSELPYTDVAKPDLVAVILKHDVPRFVHAVARPLVEFAGLD